jgi:hypothetical protein
MIINPVEHIGKYFTAFVNQNHETLLNQYKDHVKDNMEHKENPLMFPIFAYFVFNEMAQEIMKKEIHPDLTMEDIHNMTPVNKISENLSK